MVIIQAWKITSAEQCKVLDLIYALYEDYDEECAVKINEKAIPKMMSRQDLTREIQLNAAMKQLGEEITRMI